MLFKGDFMKINNVFLSTFVIFCLVQVGWGQAAWINEISYDMTSGDDDDFIEIVAPEGTNMSVYGILLINGSGDKAYDYVQLSGTISSTNAQNGHGFLILITNQSGDIIIPSGVTSQASGFSSIQNGAPDGAILINSSSGATIHGIWYEESGSAPSEIANNSEGPLSGGDTYSMTGVDVVSIGDSGSGASGNGIGMTGAAPSGTWGTMSSTVGVINTGESSLPVELTLFTATSQKGAVKLSWVTESEIDNLGFLIDRSLEPNSGFNTVADYRFVPELQGQGSVTYRTDYSYTDREVVPGTKYYYVLSDVTGNPEHGEPVTRHTDKMVSATPKWQDMSSALINGFKTFKAYPNPFNPKTVIAYELEDVRKLSVNIVNVYGRQITELYNGIQASGYHEVVWQPKDISAGIYFCHLTSGGDTITRKLVLLK